jgi:hypothetical protein
LEKIAIKLDVHTERKAFQTFVADSWIVHDFTHCGMQTIQRHYSAADGIGPNRSETEIAKLVQRSVVVLGLSCSVLLQELGDTARALEVASLATRHLE